MIVSKNMSNLLELQVYVEDIGELKTLWLTPEEHEKAINDQQFISSLLSKESKHAEKEVTESLQNENISPRNEEDTSPSAQEKDTSKYIWSDPGVLLLLDLCKKKEDDFSNGKKRHNQIWTEIADEVKLLNYNVTGTQCSMKLAGLKRTYKQIKDNNRKSGNARYTWGLYSAVDSVFGEKAWAEPKYLASSDSFLPENKCKNTSPTNPKKGRLKK